METSRKKWSYWPNLTQLRNMWRKLSGTLNITTYLGENIKKELISEISEKIVEAMVCEIKQSKYFSIILDCTPDITHIEQLSVVIRTVSVENQPQVKEHFIGFLEAEASTGEELSELILQMLEELEMSFDNCRGAVL